MGVGIWKRREIQYLHNILQAFGSRWVKRRRVQMNCAVMTTGEPALYTESIRHLDLSRLVDANLGASSKGRFDRIRFVEIGNDNFGLAGGREKDTDGG
jgi:hypothetical protein